MSRPAKLGSLVLCHVVGLLCLYDGWRMYCCWDLNFACGERTWLYRRMKLGFSAK